ncbi:hypothetical protein AX15_005583 [Amanita polypyramis BW_CC]|nr:hypothetical protein AX15_005583 [Amanita polypyramis BW_CC]
MSSSVVAVPSFKLNDGNVIPAVGIGCWMGRVGEGEHVVNMVRKAVDIGYRHIDTAANYGLSDLLILFCLECSDVMDGVGDEESVGRALRESGVPRADVYIVTKLASEDHGRVAEAFNTSLRKLGVEYVDLYLMHWPQALKENGDAYAKDESPTFVETWLDMEKLLRTGKVKSIGVSNFSVKTLNELLPYINVVPAVNQVEAHPCLPQHELLAFCKEKGILVTAYSPVGKFMFASHKGLVEIARRKGATRAQILMSWGVQRGTAVIPKSEKEDRLRENIALVRLTEEEMHVLDEMHKEPGMHRSVCGFHIGALGGSCFGWTYEQLGWEMVTGGVVPG